jgi:hypothetical protein
MAVVQKIRRLRLYCFDVEARPGPWSGGDFTYKHMLSIAGGYEGGPVDYLAPGFTRGQLRDFVLPIREPNIIVCHNGKYDLGLLTGTLIAMDLPPLGKVLLSDTMRHLPKNGYAFSRGLGDMCKRFGVSEPKGHMGAYDWEQVYAGDPAALDRLRDYNRQDVTCTLALRRALADVLLPPRIWKP